jgi:hypothetical protein
MKKLNPIIPVDDPPITREEMMAWINSEIAENVFFINDIIPDGGTDYLVKKSREYANMLRDGKADELEEIWLRRS